MGRVVIIGGGISGLAAAHRLQRLAPRHRVTLIEGSGRLGGKIGSERDGGFLLEQGPESFLTRKQPGIELCRELGIEGRLIGRSPRGGGSFIYRSGRLHPLPAGFSGLVPGDPAALESTELLSAEGKRRVLEEPEVPHAADGGRTESVAQFMTRRYGREAFEAMIEPLLCGIFAGDAAKLSIAAAFPQLTERERRLAAGTASAAPRRRSEAPRGAADNPLPPFASFPEGMGELVEALARELRSPRVVTRTMVNEVAQSSEGFRVTTDSGSEAAEAVIVATPPDVTSRLAAALSPPLAEAHGGIPASSTVVVHLGYARAFELDGYGYVVPAIEGRWFHACTWSSSKWAGRAPEGSTLLRLYGGRYGGEDPSMLSDAEILEAAHAELDEVLGISSPPTIERIVRWPSAIPQYNLGHRERLAAIEEALGPLEGLFLAGAAYRGVGIPDCIATGRDAAERAAAYLDRLSR